MQSGKQKLLSRAKIAFALCFCAHGALAETPAIKPRRLAAAIPVGSLRTTYSNLVAPVSPLKPQDALYLQYFSNTDASVYRQYQDRWDYHEKQIRFAATRWNYEHLSIGSLDFYGRAPYEGDVRRNFAEQVLRVRIDSAIKEYFRDTQATRAVAKAQHTVNQLKSVPLKVGSGAHPGEFRVGYDVLSDSSKLEYTQGAWFAGVYHSHLVSALSGGRGGQNDLIFRASASLGNQLPSASLSYQPGTTLVEASLSKQLTRTVGSRVISSTPTVAGAAPCNYRVEVSYQFF